MKQGYRSPIFYEAFISDLFFNKPYDHLFWELLNSFFSLAVLIEFKNGSAGLAENVS